MDSIVRLPIETMNHKSASHIVTIEVLAFSAAFVRKVRFVTDRTQRPSVENKIQMNCVANQIRRKVSSENYSRSHSIEVNLSQLILLENSVVSS